MTNKEERIRKLAHAIWIEEDQPEGRAAQHWERARHMVEAEDLADKADAGTETPRAASPGSSPSTSTPRQTIQRGDLSQSKSPSQGKPTKRPARRTAKSRKPAPDGADRAAGKPD